MNILKHNFYLVFENWTAQFRAHRLHRRTVKAIRKHGRELKMRIIEANELHQATKKAYYCLPDPDGIIRVLDKANIKTLKKFKVMDRAVTCIDLLTEAEYSTMNNHFVVLFHTKNNMKSWAFFRGTILEAMDRYKDVDCQILGNFERVVTIQNGKVIKH